MERLTLDKAIKHAKEVAKTNRAEATYNFPNLKEYYDNCAQRANQYNKLVEWLEELKSYKEAEEQGLLMKLLCKVGTEVFAILPRDSHCTKCQIKKIEIRPTIFGKICYFAEPVAQRGCCFRYFDTEFGKVIFLTREEAEKKLEEMKK
jgi:hypothetical protein|nr:MAG TPA: hypothetical protein [Caudoviricetes sp.]